MEVKKKWNYSLLGAIDDNDTQELNAIPSSHWNFQLFPPPRVSGVVFDDGHGAGMSFVLVFVLLIVVLKSSGLTCRCSMLSPQLHGKETQALWS